MDYHATILAIGTLLNKHRFDLQNEKILQQQVEDVFRNSQVPYEREVKLNNMSIIDFVIDGVGIELKINGSGKEIYRQLVRYSEFPQIKALVLITNKALLLPKYINGKYTHIINLGISWL